jgi:hypothetical protein
MRFPWLDVHSSRATGFREYRDVPLVSYSGMRNTTHLNFSCVVKDLLRKSGTCFGTEWIA